MAELVLSMPLLGNVKKSYHNRHSDSVDLSVIISSQYAVHEYLYHGTSRNKMWLTTNKSNQHFINQK